MSLCTKCRMPLEEGSRFCGGCGSPVVGSGATAAEAVVSEVLAGERHSGPSDAGRKPAPRVSSSRTLLGSSPPPVAVESEAVSVPKADSTNSASSADSRGFSLGGSASLFRDDDPYVGTTLNNRFIVESKIGEGGFGAVYKALQKGTNRVVAVKLLHPEMTREHNVVQRFRREGEVLCRLKDAHTVTTYDFDQTADGTLYIAMEMLEGRSLHDIYATDAPITWKRMLRILSEMCSSLGEAHQMGIVHRDLKPENVHLEKRSGNDEFVKILDFGIAKVLHGDGLAGTNVPQLTATGQTLGTLEYMSPEQLMGKDLDGRSDIYGLGVLAYELLTGYLPFPDAVGPAMLITAQLRKTPKTPSSAYPQGNFPADVDTLILKMLGKHRDERFIDVSALRHECLRILAASADAAPDVVVDHASSAVVQTPAPDEGTSGATLPVADARAFAEVAEPSASLVTFRGPAGAPGPQTQAILTATAPRSKLPLLLLAGALLLGGAAAAFWFGGLG